MKRLRQWLFNVLAALSLLLSIATVALWVTTYRNSVSLELDPNNIRSIESFHGSLSLIILPGLPANASAANWSLYASTLQHPAFKLPHWLVALAALIFPSIYWPLCIKQRRKNRRFNAGLCPSCGYDLRATPAQCPECGVIPQKTI